MSIKSHAFGRVTLTAEDAKKFEAQVSHGRPKAAAVEAVRRGVAMSRDMQTHGGKIVLTLKEPAK